MKTLQRKTPDIRFAFFGTSHIAVFVLDRLEKAGFLPARIVTIPEKAKGRGLLAQQTPVELWAHARKIPVSHDWEAFKKDTWDVAIVVDYGKIIPGDVLEIPRKGFLNVHPSLLPRLRGPSPIRSAILHDERMTGVSIIFVDEEMDHGPLIAQKKVDLVSWPLRNSELEKTLLSEGGALLAQVLPLWVRGEIEVQPQNHDVATYCEKFAKNDGLLGLADDPHKNLLKIRAFEGWPTTFAFFVRDDKRIRVQILDAEVMNGKLAISRVKPEGKREMDYAEFLRSGATPVT